MKHERLLEEIKSRIDIIDFISDYVQLKKAGQNYKGLCPFHAEKVPSFMVSPSKQIFHCFGCGVGGDVVSFLMKHENISFGEAIRHIAKKAGIKVTDFAFDRASSEKREAILRINREAMKFYVKNLDASSAIGGPARAYLRKRGIDQASLERFCIGYAPEERDGLFKYLKKMGYSEHLIKDAGLVTSDERSHRDVFRGRIIFPIFNYQNEVIAFGGRVMDDTLPKYLNSSETEVFKKGETLFALNLAKDDIRKAGFAIIVEGYLDAIICHQYGFKNTIAPLGTALTSRQLQRLKSLVGKVLLVFDSDDAGIAAAKRSLAILCVCDFRAKVVLLPKGEDPDSFLRKNGSEPFRKMLSQASSMIDFILRTSRGDKIETVKECLDMIALISDPLIAGEMLRELAEKSRSNESDLRIALKGLKKKTGHHTLETLRPAKAARNEEHLLLSTVIAFPEKAETVLSRLTIEDLRDEVVRSVFRKIKASGGNVTMTALLNEADNEEKALITHLSLRPGFDLEHADKNIDDCLHTLIKKRLDEKRKLAEESEDIALLNSLLKEKRRLLKTRS
ncbi:MAG: DNA primase [Nitrospira sp.]|nr:DNA primase [Nitrospira sp.]